MTLKGPGGARQPAAPSAARRPRREQGSATILMLGVVAMLLALTVAGLTLAGAVIASHQARTAVDLAALAAAAGAMRGEPSGLACARAVTVAAANKARLTRCQVEGDEVLLQVAVRPPGGRWGDAVARARAGPAPG